MLKKEFFWGFFFLLIIAANLQAEPTIYGPTGLITVPTAESLRYKEYNASLGYFSVSSKNAEVHYHLNLGTFKSIELGFIGKNDKEGVFINVKAYLMADQAKDPLSLALGAKNLTSKENTNVYLVASKKINPKISAHLGFCANLTEKVTSQIMGGTEILLMGNHVSFVGDFAGSDEQWFVNSGARFFLAEKCTFSIFLVDLLKTDGDNIITVGQITWTDFI
ncbi:MAG: hypothetical protein OMM_04933 [Candidatus Magnetoglobus multicellularis str. Araruama]|uniref:Uncharacterized protein n=1 Tax=Candidatus Magnetoglobus multicellularis str. Araruama TaxID=890399 RepID=A0A1V1NYW6_9BACT|nr:MAG: hypothetical protein OMM_04933 [Candidatus Magnetoglobus multicellularis str. Araruama]